MYNFFTFSDIWCSNHQNMIDETAEARFPDSQISRLPLTQPPATLNKKLKLLLLALSLLLKGMNAFRSRSIGVSTVVRTVGNRPMSFWGRVKLAPPDKILGTLHCAQFS